LGVFLFEVGLSVCIRSKGLKTLTIQSLIFYGKEYKDYFRSEWIFHICEKKAKGERLKKLRGPLLNEKKNAIGF
jgi:hypothetical protein